MQTILMQERIKETLDTLKDEYVRLGLEMETLNKIKNDPELFNLLGDKKPSLGYRIELTFEHMYFIAKTRAILTGNSVPDEVNLMDSVLYKAREDQKVEDERVRMANIEKEKESIRVKNVETTLDESYGLP